MLSAEVVVVDFEGLRLKTFSFFTKEGWFVRQSFGTQSYIDVHSMLSLFPKMQERPIFGVTQELRSLSSGTLKLMTIHLLVYSHPIFESTILLCRLLS